METKNIIELVKWFIGSVVIVVVTLIVESGFKERETGMEEMKIYNQYVDIILQADNIEQRYRLAQYFSIVTPTERLRERWIDYKYVLVEDYEKYKDLQRKESIVLSQPRLMLDTLVVLQEKQKQLNRPLIKKSSTELAIEYERLGFESLINRDVNKAISYFKQSEDSYNGFHSVYDIYIYLLRNKNKLIDPYSEEWNVVYFDVLNKYSWGMPEVYRNKFEMLL